MEHLQIKRGRIETIGEDRITILNLDGFCEDILQITPGEAIYIQERIGFEKHILYSAKDGRLIQAGLEKAIPRLWDLYESLPKEIECSTIH